jgi:uncharacterized protein
MLVVIARYSRDQAFTVVRGNAVFIVAMTAGSVTRHPARRPTARDRPQPSTLPALALILLISAVKLWRH